MGAIWNLLLIGIIWQGEHVQMKNFLQRMKNIHNFRHFIYKNYLLSQQIQL